MTSNPLLIFDFDGVIVDGMEEYWWSARKACLDLLPTTKSPSALLPQSVPNTFKKLRPWVHQGWEMVLLAAELSRHESNLSIRGPTFFSLDYKNQCQQALEIWGWESSTLQKALDQARLDQIKYNFSSWINTFPVINA